MCTYSRRCSGLTWGSRRMENKISASNVSKSSGLKLPLHGLDLLDLSC